MKPGQTIGEYIDNVIAEGMKQALTQKALEEKEKQTAAGEEKPDDDLFMDPGGDATTEPGEVDTAEVEPGQDDVEAMEEVPELDDVVEKLNALRSGRSLSDEDVSAAFEDYFNGLEDPEKVALFTFMKGIAQIVTGEVPGEQAVEPGEKPADVEMEKGPSRQKVTVKPHVIKKPLPPPGKKTSSEEEDTTPPAPIEPKKR